MRPRVNWNEMRTPPNGYKKNGTLKTDWKWVVGIDPGTHTGFAVYSVQRRAFAEIQTLSFWEAFDRVTEYPVETTKVVVEVPSTKAVWQTLPKTGLRTLQRQAVNVGGVLREAELLADGLFNAGYLVIRAHPIGKTDKKRFQRITGFMDRLNQHQRDAGMLCWGGRPTSF